MPPPPCNPLPSKFALILYPGFQLLDAAGPLDAFNMLSYDHPITLYILASTLDPVSTHNAMQRAHSPLFAQSLLPTHTFATAPDDIDVVLLPGGLGARGEESEAYMGHVVAFLRGLGLGRGEKEGMKWILTVCTGSEILARTGALHGRRATTNKSVFGEVKATHPRVNWIPKARWVVDGNIWTSSGVSAGMDLAFAWIAHVFGQEQAQYLADRSEYERNPDADRDWFAERWGAV
ncbi:uncharacterized protein SETTUDRAFT_139755 [Exserohilum turcica Et28A]|uniref:DJ-1/PfpI domain-containing protein n=1 Tax=Exserohilum turcicum (strain 28A) TaxID=671987 RepID=R0K4M5_EXST2|nr:uncharacterized protein SETTUDRAFT_139755 [Exserohilum turcica Et28A]EOA83292.1 hypothetical protein SETTUDRAFT_139755 [Exserohilum turcica Et28A]